MARPSRISDDDARAAAAGIEGWEVADGRLRKTFEFADFVQAWGFMSRVALIAERMDHHPDWTNVYRTVRVELHTHDAGGITALDLEIARKMNDLS